jgi:hypothetical protein
MRQDRLVLVDVQQNVVEGEMFGFPVPTTAPTGGPISVGLQQAFGVSELALHHHDLDQARRPPSPALDVLRSVWGSVLGELDARTDPWLDVLRCSGRRARPT